MKGKAILCFAIVLSMTLAIMPAVKASPTKLEVIFEATGTTEFEATAALIGKNFTVALVITDITDLWSWKVNVTWNPAVISLAKDPEEGPFLSRVGLHMFAFKGIASGVIGELSNTLFVEDTDSGSGDLAYLTFTVLGIGETYIELGDVNFVDLGEVTIPIDVVTPGHFTLPPPPPTPPKAKFTPSDGAYFFVCDNVTLDATTSTDGYDTLPDPGNACPIVSYTWDIDIGNDGQVDFTLDGEIAEFHCNATGDVAINLTVYAPDPTTPTHPDYVDTDSETHVIHQVLKPVGPAIDVYTEKGGQLPGAPSDAFGPQEEVTVYALVIYNEEPLEYKPVAFVFQDPNGTARDYRTAFTDASGIAVTEFRIPWEGSGAEDMFGTWTIIGTATVAEVTVNDTCSFEFGYILSIRGITVTGSPLKKGEILSVKADIKNIAFISKNAFLTIVLYDECGVPIGLATGSITVEGEDGETSVYTITIPGWAFVGTGKVYVNLYTNPPEAGGTPICPEGETPFTILKT